MDIEIYTKMLAPNILPFPLPNVGKCRVFSIFPLNRDKLSVPASNISIFAVAGGVLIYKRLLFLQ